MRAAGDDSELHEVVRRLIQGLVHVRSYNIKIGGVPFR